MRFLPFLAILIVGAGTLLLGVDLMTLPQKPVAQLTGVSTKLATHRTNWRSTRPICARKIPKATPAGR